jgi:hypothetical protein
VYRGDLGDVVYDFTWSRNRDGRLKMLAGYWNYLQVDAAPAYDDVFEQYPEIIEVGCMAHARPYFKEGLPTAAVPCAQALATIKQLYGIERVRPWSKSVCSNHSMIFKGRNGRALLLQISDLSCAI